MKTRVLFPAVSLLLLLASCAKESADSLTPEGVATYSFTLTQGSGTSTKSFSDGLTATVLKFAVYTYSDGAVGDVIPTLSDTEGEECFTGLTTTVDISLPIGGSYTIIFWAEALSNPYNVDFTEKTVSYTSTESLEANVDSYDAFLGRITIENVTGNGSESVTLTRPFAQVNVGSDDVDEYESSYSLNYTKLVVSGAYSALSLLDGSGSGDETTLTFGYSSIPGDEAGDFPYSSDYSYLAMAYVPVGAESTIAGVTFYYSASTDDEDGHNITVGSAPVAPNCRTNIYGSLLTGSWSFSLDKGDTEDDENITTDCGTAEDLAYALLTGVGSIALTGDVDMSSYSSSAMAVLSTTSSIDLGGYTLSGTSLNVSEDGTSVTISNGTLSLSNTYGLIVDSNKSSLTLESMTITPSAGSYGVVVGLSGGEDGSSQTEDISLTVKNSSITVTGYVSGILIQGTASGHIVTVENSTIDSQWFGIAENMATDGNTITVSGTTITSTYACLTTGSSDTSTSNLTTVTVTDCNFTGTDESPIEVVHTNLTVSSSTLACNATSQSYSLNTRGTGGVGYGIVLGSNTSGVAFIGSTSLSDITYNLGYTGTGAYNVCYYDGTSGVDYTTTTGSPSDGSVTD